MVSPGSITEQFSSDLRAERQEHVYHVLLAATLAVALVAGTYLVLAVALGRPPLEALAGTVPDTGLSRAAAVLFSRTVIQPINLTLFFLGFWLLVVRVRLSSRELEAFSRSFFEGIPTGQAEEVVVDVNAFPAVLQNAQSIARGYAGAVPLLVRRFEMMGRRLVSGGTVDQAQGVLSEASRIDWQQLESRYTAIRYLVWVIPTLGFLGTVLGMGSAISGFTSVLSAAGEGAGGLADQMRPVLGTVARDLGTAFDTTLLALLLSAVLVALTSVVQSREESLLAAVDEFCVRHFLTRITLEDPAVMALRQGLLNIAQAYHAGLQQVAAAGVREAAATPEETLQHEGLPGDQRELLALLTETRDHVAALAAIALRMERRRDR